MPLGIQQNNNFAQIIVDIWNDKVFYQEQEFPAGFIAASILNISEDDLKELIQAGGAPTFLFPVVIQGSDMEAAQVLPVLRWLYHYWNVRGIDDRLVCKSDSPTRSSRLLSGCYLHSGKGFPAIGPLPKKDADRLYD